MEHIEDIYSELVMEHSINSPYKHDLESQNCSLHGHNPSCGDDITLKLEIKDGVIVDGSFLGHGCAISQSSTSIMLETLIGKSLDEAKKIVDIFVDMIDRKPITEKQKQLLGDAVAFENIKDMPARVKCALLSWRTLQNMIEEQKKL